MKRKKHFVNYDKETGCLVNLFASFGIVSCIYLLVKNAIYDGNFQLMFSKYLIFCLIVIPLIVISSLIYAIYHSEMIEFNNDSICLYRFIFSKTPRCKIPISEISYIVISNGLWEKKGKDILGRKVYMFSHNDLVKKLDLNGKTLLEIFSIFDKDKIEVIGDNFHPMSINKFFRIDFYSLTNEQKLALLKRYCHGTKSRELDGENFLKKKKLL